MIATLLSGKASPGVSATTWAVALSWQTTPLLVVDADVHGGDLAPGLLLGRAPIDRGLWTWHSATRRADVATASAALMEHVVALPEAPHVRLLAGFQRGEQARGMDASTWERLAQALQFLSQTSDMNVLVDAARVETASPWPVVTASDKVLLVCRPTGRSTHWARNAVPQLADRLSDLSRVSLLVVGKDPYSPKEVAAQVGVELFETLAHDPDTAAVFTDGAPVRMRGLQHTPLMKSATRVANYLGGLAFQQRQAPPAQPPMASGVWR